MEVSEGKSRLPGVLIQEGRTTIFFGDNNRTLVLRVSRGKCRGGTGDGRQETGERSAIGGGAMGITRQIILPLREGGRGMGINPFALLSETHACLAKCEKNIEELKLRTK